MRERTIIFSLMLIMSQVLPDSVFGKDFGTNGATFEIKEEGFLAMIYRKLKSVDMQQEQKKMQDIARKRVEEPMAVAGIKRTEKAQSFTFDPTYTLEEDALLPNGKLLYKAGTTVNPFDHMHLEKKLIFIDGRDEEQVEWFKGQRRIEQIKEEDKLILVAGRPFDLEKELDREVYFDQSGSLVQKFKIEQVPAIVEQEEKVLRIREIVVN